MTYSKHKTCSSLLFFFFVSLLSLSFAQSFQVSHDSRAITIDGERKIILSGSIHYPRSTPEMWPDLIRKSKEGGLDAIETYIFWNAHEPVRRQYDFSGNLDFIRFIKTVQDQGLYAVLRIGPYVCAEWSYGGFPVWLHNLPGVEFRTANDVFMREMQNFTTLIVDMVKKEKLFASQGGPIILSQIENEFGNVMKPYGDGGKVYIDWAAKMAVSLNVGVPWLMCQQPNAPQPMLQTCNGFYCHDYTPDNPNTPKMWTENWTGWFKSWGGPDPYRTAEDVAYAVARFIQAGGTFQNYYMYHGGTNFGRTAGGPYITTTYDYNAPLDEYGNKNEPKYSHLKQLHSIVKSMEKTLTHGNVTTMDFGSGAAGTVYMYGNKASCFFSNDNTSSDVTISYQNKKYTIPAWSVSILPDCQEEVYNSAKVNTQTSVMVKKANQAENEPLGLKWSWRPENVDDALIQGKGLVSATRLLDQKAFDDASDYLWYMTSVNLDKNDPIWSKNMSLRVNTTGQVLHAYINGEHVGSQWADYNTNNYLFEKQVKLNPGTNQISLLSAAVGYKNYGSFFDTAPSGLPGPVEIVGWKDDETITKDLSSHPWTYKVDLHGFENKVYSSQSRFVDKWESDSVPINRSMTWYKTTFKAPLGDAPVVVDLQGLGKGFAWVNGNNLGRYWPSFLAAADGCADNGDCDYRGSYGGDKCVTKCGEPTQRWYHVPRSFLSDSEPNELVLFEEFGGDPAFVNFQTIVVGKACGSAYENKTLELSCNGRPISDIKFASLGDGKGTCGSFEKGSCEAINDPSAVLHKACVGKQTCSVLVNEDTFGPSSCGATPKKLIVEAVCGW